MTHYILASHGMFSRGILSSVEMIVGNVKNIHIITAYLEETLDVKDEIFNLIESIPKDDEIIACTDVFGGSVNNELMKYINRNKFHLITGMNLPFLISLFLSEEEDINKTIANSIEEAREGLIYCNRILNKIEDEDF